MNCPACHVGAYLIGPLHAVDRFAGKRLTRSLPASALFRCPACRLGFRWPQVPKEELDLLYAQGEDDSWAVGAAAARPDFDLAQQWVERHLPAQASLLDVGCFDGAFLQRFVPGRACAGIEIHPGARDVAVARGVRIVGDDFDVIDGTYDCITAFDVIEHTVNPASFLAACLDRLAAGGLLIISTGNFDAWTFRWMGSAYGYCTLAEHLSFVGPTWLADAARRQHFEVVESKTFSHEPSGLPRRLKQLVSNVAYRLNPELVARLRDRRAPARGASRPAVAPMSPPSWISARDHFITLLRKC